jgi:ABC-type tungstate transport system permease subunit
MKKSITIFLLALFIMSIPAALFADSPVNLRTRGEAKTFSGSIKPFINTAGETMVPLGYLNDLGVWAGWNAQTETITLISDKTVVITKDQTTVDGKTASKIPFIITGATPYVKLRSVADAFGLRLTWDEASRTVNVVNTLSKPVASTKSLILATTTSTQDSGLLDFLLPEFEKDTGIVVKTISVGSGAAIKMGTDGEADVLLVHSPSQEISSMGAGDAISRNGLMYNDFIVVGPDKDPAGVRAANNDVVAAFKAISAKGSAFVSRGDKSGTDTLEKSLWSAAGIKPEPKNYLEAATGMLATLTIAEQKGAYTVTDRATYLKNLDKLRLPIRCDGDKLLLKPYSVMVVNP